MSIIDGIHSEETSVIQTPRPFLESIENLLSELKFQPVRIELINDVPGSGFHTLRKVFTNNGVYLLKFRHGSEPAYFATEARGLYCLAQTQTVQTPKVVLEGFTAGFQFMVMEFVFSGHKKPDFWKTLAGQIAALHRNTSPAFGLDHDNFIGLLPQKNNTLTHWDEFFITKRILPQVELGINNKVFDRDFINQVETVLVKASQYFPAEPPALLHGDLWAGNILPDEKGNPLLIDPAIYYGHREAEIAFTQLFNGIPEEFLDAYNEVFPLEVGFSERIRLYNLYPLLVHANIYGGRYIEDVLQTVRMYS